MNLTPDQKAVGRDNYYEAIGVSRRDFMKQVIATGAVSGAGLGAMYFGYGKIASPLRVGVIGTGDEGQVLIGAVNPDYIEVKAIADIRPYNIHRAFHGDWAGETALAARPGLISKYKWNSEEEAKKHVKVYDKDYHDLLKDKDIEAVIIALPLHLHAKVSIEAMKAGKHVLGEKLMAHNVAQCKVMGRVAEEKDVYLSIGHQRHYSVLYDNAVNLLRWGILGQLHHIRAQWHRGNLPGKDSWQQPLPGGDVNPATGNKVDKIGRDLARYQNDLSQASGLAAIKLEKMVAQWKAWDEDKNIKPEDFDYREISLPNGKRSAMEELCRWRLWERTGGGLMAELGSHQLDAASIFCSSLRKDGKKAHPLTVHAVGGREIFGLDREAEDHVYCMFEFPGPEYDPTFPVGYKDEVLNFPTKEKGISGYETDPNKKIVVTYSSINGNGFGGYGEVVMGTRGTMILEREQELMLYKDSDTSSKISVKNDKGGPTLDTQASGGPAAAVAKAASEGPVSRGYTEEIEHWAWCIRNKDKANQPRCRPEIAMGDAIIALTTNVAIKRSMRGEGGYIKFEDDWYDMKSDSTPDGSDVKKEYDALTK